jgi:glycosyltransferase involved in cell wall biosynthesis
MSAARKVALAHDWLTGMRGGERVLERLCARYPAAAIHTLIHHAPAVSDRINSHPIHTSFLQRIPGIARSYRNFLPLYPAAVGAMSRPQADLLISTSHCAIKSLPTHPDTRHLCYCFTPMRYAWTFYTDYFGRNPIKAVVIKPILAALRRWDRRTAGRVDRFVAISAHVRERIRRFYGLEADVVHPPVDTAYWTPGPAPQTHDGYDLVVSALVPYKRVDLAVRAYTRAGLPLKIVGSGRAYDALCALAGPTVSMLGRQPDHTLRDLYRGCRCLVFPGEEDFGIVPLEAQACGRPVVAYGVGGVRETVRPDETGIFFAEQSEDALLDAVSRAAAVRWDPGAIRAHAARFGCAPFEAGLSACIEKLF